MTKTYLSEGEVLTPLGLGTRVNFEAIQKGRTALKVQKGWNRFEHSFCAAMVESFEPLKQYTRLESMLISVIERECRKCGTDLKQQDSLLILSTTKGNIDLLSESTFGPERVYIPQLAETLGNYFHCAHTPLIVSNACVSGVSAVITAQRMVASGMYAHVMVAAADLVSEFVLSGFYCFNALSEMPCTPFDAKRNGINLGEAAAAVSVGNKPVEQSDGVSLLHPGAGSNDANHISGPSREGTGLVRCLAYVLEQNPNVSFINAHGTATIYNDEMEAIAFHRKGLGNLPLNSLKGYFGHTLGTAGLLELILSNYSMHQNELVVSKGFKESGVSVPVQVIQTNHAGKINGFIKTASGFGGTNAAVVVTKL